MPKVVIELEWDTPDKPTYRVTRYDIGVRTTYYEGPYKMSAGIAWGDAAKEIEDYLWENDYYA